MEETRIQLEQRLASYKAELPLEQKRLPDLELALRAALESHIESCYRELRRLENHNPTACSGEADMQGVLDAEEELVECIDRIAGLERDIPELEEELADETLWV